MANKKEKYSNNVKGRYYVDRECIGCDACTMTANSFFAMQDDGDTMHAYVQKQPETTADEELCKEALEGCPVEAIGNDGD
jgi:ferredoxin